MKTQIAPWLFGALVGMVANAAFAADYGYELEFLDDRYPDKPFIVHIAPENDEGLQSFERYLEDGELVPDPQEPGTFVLGVMSGVVVPADEAPEIPAGHAWNFVLDPTTILFADMATEICDGSIANVEERLDWWLDSVPGARWCPWNTRRLIRSFRVINPGTPD